MTVQNTFQPNEKNQTSVRKPTLPSPVVPAVDIYETENGITLFADMPGVSKENLSLHVDNNVLYLEGLVALPVPEGVDAVSLPVTGRRYARNFTLSRELNTENISAEFQSGVLTLNIPKSDAQKPRKIEIQVH